jgi:hypothetical protein
LERAIILEQRNQIGRLQGRVDYLEKIVTQFIERGTHTTIIADSTINVGAVQQPARDLIAALDEAEKEGVAGVVEEQVRKLADGLLQDAGKELTKASARAIWEQLAALAPRVAASAMPSLNCLLTTLTQGL